MEIAKKRLSRWGMILCSAFVCYAAYNVFLVFTGAWQAAIVVAIVTFPFSVAVNILCDWLQDIFQMSNQARSSLELLLFCLSGIVEFYLIGAVIEKLLMRKKIDTVDEEP